MPSSSNPVIHFEVQADNIGRAKAFYEKAFGWKIEQVMTKEKGGMDYWGLTTRPDGKPGINGGLYERPADNKLTTFDCTIHVENIDAAIKAVTDNGGSIRAEKSEIPGVGWFARCNDTEGNIFGLLQSTGWMAK
ncbi:MAG: VOC family protein [Candidatus Peribacteraceae bacterium]|nr:VOC family protein [Candidatus Peribacteraceae bacterium]